MFIPKSELTCTLYGLLVLTTMVMPIIGATGSYPCLSPRRHADERDAVSVSCGRLSPIVSAGTVLTLNAHPCIAHRRGKNAHYHVIITRPEVG